MAVLFGLLGVIIIALARVHVTVPNWIFLTVYIAGGLIGMISGLIAIFRGRGRTRLVGVLGFLLCLGMELLGLSALALSQTQFLPSGPFL